MNNNSYIRLSAIIFLIIGIVHLARVLTGWSATIGSTALPMWASWLALIVAFVLSYFGFKLNSKA